jgi:hypothetical protein
MNGTPSLAFTVADLQRFLTRAEPAALLVPPRILRRVIKRDRGLGGPGLQVPHHKSYVLDRDRLLGIADRDELGVDPARELPPTLLLFPRPDSPRDREATLLKYWRLLFHARVHFALQVRDTSEGVQDRIRRIGPTEFDEATAVLRQEHFLLPPGDARTVYEEFAAVYLELRYFAPHLLPVYFPACARFETIDATLALDVDAAALFAATRLEGAPDPAPAPAILPPLEDELDQPPARSVSEGDRQSSLTLRVSDIPRTYRRFLNRAERASARGNMVRAAIFRMRAVPLAPSGQVNPTRAAARHEIERFSTRLQKALGYSDAVAGDWRQALLALLEPAAQGIWPVESRMLYDLQKACIDQERPVYAVDLVEWFVTWGRRPIKRLLPFHDSVRTVKHLRSAMHRLTAIRIAKPIRLRLLALLIESTHQDEHRLRERLRPVLRAALDKVGLMPRNIAEQTARDKVVEELIDRIVEHGFFGMGDLRDAIARNRLKLPDLAENDEPVRGAPPHPQPLSPRGERGEKNCSPLPRFGGEGLGVRRRFGLARSVARGIKTFFLGDPLIRANRQLAAALDGVYHRGEIYSRWLQRLSAAAFGTHIGRLLTLYVALPFGCAIALLKVWDEVTERIVGGPPEGSEAAKEAAKHINPYAFTLLGLFFLALFHVAPFRRGLLHVCVKLWRTLCWLFGDLPARLLRSPWMVRLLQSRTWLFCYQFLLKPLPWAVLSALGLIYLGVARPISLSMGVAVFAAAAFLLNSRLGRYVEEAWTDRLVRTWQLIHSDIVPGLVRWVIYLFRRLQEEVERIIYTADEWLRFRPGDSRLSLVVKPALGLFWFCFTYIFRLIFNLFVEPTINPIKHFPVVTVTAKLILPITGQLLEFFRTPIEPVLGKALGNTVALTAIGLLPGLGGFLVWEFKENWRLYRANQSPTLRPEIVGHHGETVLRLMRPGLHSGTLPKLYARLRHAKGRSARKKHEVLHHLGTRLRQFVERDLLAVLSGSQSWGRSTPLTPGEIAIATNRIRLELAGPGASVHVNFEEHAGFLVAGLTCPVEWPETWLARLTREQEAAFRDALAGFYKLAGVDVVREQVAALLPAEAVYDLTAEGLVVWPTSEGNGEFIYPLDDGGELSPQPRDSSSFSALPPLAADALLYSATPIRWADWVQTWQLDHDGKGHAPLLPPRVRLLPALRR